MLITTMQAVSGAGYPSVLSLDILDNVMPYISSEEDEPEWELKKILGGMCNEGRAFNLHEQVPLSVSVACNRVPVLEGTPSVVEKGYIKHPQTRTLSACQYVSHTQHAAHPH